MLKGSEGNQEGNQNVTGQWRPVPDNLFIFRSTFSLPNFMTYRASLWDTI